MCPDFSLLSFVSLYKSCEIWGTWATSQKTLGASELQVMGLEKGELQEIWQLHRI